MTKFFVTSLALAGAVLLTAACERGPCNNSVSGNSNIASCGGSGDDQDIEQVTPAPVVVPPVVVPPVIAEPSA